MRNYFLVIYHQGNFYGLPWSGYWVIPNITIANLCKPFQEVIIISVSVDPFKPETVERKGKNTKNKISWKQK